MSMWDAFIQASYYVDEMRKRWEDEGVPNTFRSNPKPREGYIDARRDDGCVAVITTLEQA